MTKRFACFIGWSDTGKTGFMEACAATLVGLGRAVGAIKCVHHAGSFNLPGKDSTRFFETGAEAALVSDDETVLVGRTPPAWGRPYAESLFPDAEVVLIEGRIVDGAVKVLVGGAAVDEAGLKRPLAGFDVLVTGNSGLAERARAAGLVVFGPEDSEAFTQSYLTGVCMEERDVTVTTSGIDVPINAFIMETIQNVVIGMLKPLKKTNLEGEIVIRIGPARN